MFYTNGSASDAGGTGIWWVDVPLTVLFLGWVPLVLAIRAIRSRKRT